MPWYLIIKSLYEYLKAANVADVLIIGIPEAGSIVLDEEKTVLYLARVEESELNIYHGGEGQATIELGFFTASQDPDMSKGYEILNNVELKTQKVLEEWAAQAVPVEGMDTMRIRIGAAGGNPYVERPVIGSFIDLQVDWSLRTQ